MRFSNAKKKDQFLTYKKAKIGPIFNFTAYMLYTRKDHQEIDDHPPELHE